LVRFSHTAPRAVPILEQSHFLGGTYEKDIGVVGIRIDRRCNRGWQDIHAGFERTDFQRQSDHGQWKNVCAFECDSGIGRQGQHGWQRGQFNHASGPSRNQTGNLEHTGRSHTTEHITGHGQHRLERRRWYGSKTSVEGCIGENLFNGVWRFRVASVNLVEGDGKRLFSVVVEFRNGTNKTVSLYDTGISTDRSRGINVILEDEQTLVVDYDGNAWDSAAYKAIPQGGLLRHTFTYSLNAETAKPAKFLFEVDPTKLPQNLGFKFSVPAPSFRVDLTCTK
jgi:hypothetical protein